MKSKEMAAFHFLPTKLTAKDGYLFFIRKFRQRFAVAPYIRDVHAIMTLVKFLLQKPV